MKIEKKQSKGTNSFIIILIVLAAPSETPLSLSTNLDHHPMCEFLERGLLATIHTDDPGISGIDLAYEYEVAAPGAGFSPEQIRQAQGNALEIAFLSDDEKTELISRKAG
jgi:adenosine deaminase